MQPFKGRAFQELLDMSESLNSILHCDTLDVTQRASILSQITNKPYSEMNALVSEVDRCISECCDSPCFAAIQDSIIYSYTDETLDVYWYYKVQGQDSVLMFNMAEYKKDYPELYFLEDLTTDANMLNWKAIGLIKQIHDPQEFYDLITGDQKDFGFYFMLKGYEAAIRVLGCDDLIRKKYNNNQQRIVQKCRELYSAAYSSSCKE